MLLQGESNGKSLADIINANVLMRLLNNYSEIMVSILMKFGEE